MKTGARNGLALGLFGLRELLRGSVRDKSLLSGAGLTAKNAKYAKGPGVFLRSRGSRGSRGSRLGMGVGRVAGAVEPEGRVTRGLGLTVGQSVTDSRSSSLRSYEVR